MKGNQITWGKTVAKGIKKKETALKKAYAIMKDRKRGQIMIRFEDIDIDTDTAYLGVSSPYAQIFNDERGRCYCLYVYGKKTGYWLHPDGSLTAYKGWKSDPRSAEWYMGD